MFIVKREFSNETYESMEELIDDIISSYGEIIPQILMLEIYSTSKEWGDEDGLITGDELHLFAIEVARKVIKDNIREETERKKALTAKIKSANKKIISGYGRLEDLKERKEEIESGKDISYMYGTLYW